MNFLTPTFYIITVFFIALFLLERRFQLRQNTREQKSRLLSNAVLTIFVIITSMFTVKPSIASAFDWSFSFALLKQIEMPYSLEFIAGFLLLDLSFYYWHRLNHVVPLLWRFHNVHHCDPDMDSSTAFRFHFGEVAYSALFRFVQVALIGVSLRTFALYELVFVLSTIFHHSNLKIPIRLDRLLNLLIVTPRMHEVHHSQKKVESFSNYSVVFSFWDRLHKSFCSAREFREIKIGVPAYDEAEDNKAPHLLSLPFKKQRNYWNSRL